MQRREIGRLGCSGEAQSKTIPSLIVWQKMGFVLCVCFVHCVLVSPLAGVGKQLLEKIKLLKTYEQS